MSLLDRLRDQPVWVLVVLGIAVVVVGLIVLVGIVVIFSAVLGTFVLGLGGDSGGAAAPQASFSVETDEGVSLVHTGGESIPAGELLVRIDGEGATWAERSTSQGPDDLVAAGDSIPIDASGEIRILVVYTGGEEEVVLMDVTTQV